MSKHGWSLELVQMEFRRFLHAIVLLPAPMVRSEMVLLERGDSWVVPKGARHSYRILETFTAVRSDQPTGRSTRSQRIGRNNPQIDRWIVKSVRNRTSDSELHCSKPSATMVRSGMT
jgi:hypothetical protein